MSDIRDAKGNKDRLVPLPIATLTCLRRFWQVHRNPVLLFPNRHGGLKSAHLSTTPLDRGGVQATLRQVAQDCGLKKNGSSDFGVINKIVKKQYDITY